MRATVHRQYRTRTTNPVVGKPPTGVLFPSHRDISFGKEPLSCYDCRNVRSLSSQGPSSQTSFCMQKDEAPSPLEACAASILTAPRHNHVRHTLLLSPAHCGRQGTVYIPIPAKRTHHREERGATALAAGQAVELSSHGGRHPAPTACPASPAHIVCALSLSAAAAAPPLGGGPRVSIGDVLAAPPPLYAIGRRYLWNIPVAAGILLYTGTL
jgi:hypothetical protein